MSNYLVPKQKQAQEIEKEFGESLRKVSDLINSKKDLQSKYESQLAFEKNFYKETINQLRLSLEQSNQLKGLFHSFLSNFSHQASKTIRRERFRNHVI
jgi:hypothetical protein